ncbi:MAG: carbon-nitrogen hydrolase family protein [Bacteroidota bacterium]
MISKSFFNILILLLLVKGCLFAQTKVTDISEEGRTIKIAAAQILSSWDVADNEKKITEAVIEAANQGCEVILFHEGCLTNYPVGEDIKKIDFEKVRAAEKRILGLSKEHHIAILLGSSSEEEGRYYNHVVIADENGEILGRYSKTWRAGDKPYEAGSGPVIFTVAGVEATVIICHDLRYPELARLGIAAGAQIVFIANNESGLVNENKLLGYRSMQIARATESMVYSVMANAPADPKDVDRYNCSHGNSKIVDPLGNIVDEAGSFEERLVIGELELARAHRSTVLRTIGENEKINEYYDVECENLPYRNWMREGVKLVVRLDGTDVPAYLIKD